APPRISSSFFALDTIRSQAVFASRTRSMTMTVAGLSQLDYFQLIWALRYFWFSLVANDVRSRYRRSLLGVGWSLLRPLGMTAVFCCVFGTLLHRPIREYAPYILLGMATWQYLHEAVMLGCRSFLSGAAYIRQQQVPNAIFPLR